MVPTEECWLHASVEDELLLLVDEERGAESRWNRPRKRRILLLVDTEVVDFQVQRSGIPDPDQPDLEKSDDRRQETGGREIEESNSATQAKTGLEWPPAVTLKTDF
jgi:hypothetical protein